MLNDTRAQKLFVANGWISICMVSQAYREVTGPILALAMAKWQAPCGSDAVMRSLRGYCATKGGCMMELPGIHSGAPGPQAGIV